MWPFILKIFADAGYQGARAAFAAANTGTWLLEIVKRTELHKFAVLPKRWIVERTLAWISRNRRLACDYEQVRSHRRRFHPASHDQANAATLD
jgi:putative transposase